MKVKVLMTALVITLLLGVQGFANPCDSACVDPCAQCNGYAKTGNLFSGLKKLVNGARFNCCDPCDPIVACNPCDEITDCDPCGDVCGTPRFGRLHGLFARNCTPCDPCDTECAPCDPCGTECAPCDFDGCGTPKFRLRNLFGGFSLNRGCFSDCNTDCGPCDPCNTDCGPCDPCNTDCGPCDPCFDNCNPCDDACGTYCGPRGRLFDLPRIGLANLFKGCQIGRCNDGCNPCGEVQNCLPCDNACFR